MGSHLAHCGHLRSHRSWWTQGHLGWERVGMALGARAQPEAMTSLQLTFPSNVGRRPEDGRQQGLACGSDLERGWLAGERSWRWPALGLRVFREVGVGTRAATWCICFPWGPYILACNKSTHLLSLCHVRLSAEGSTCFISVNFHCNPLRQSTSNIIVSIFYMKKPRLRTASKNLGLWASKAPF